MMNNSLSNKNNKQAVIINTLYHMLYNGEGLTVK